MKVRLIAAKPMRYGTRRLVAGEDFEAKERDANLLVRLKRATPWERAKADIPPIPKALKAAVTPQPEGEVDERAALRAEYQEKFGKRAFPGWSADELRAKLAVTAES